MPIIPEILVTKDLEKTIKELTRPTNSTNNVTYITNSPNKTYIGFTKHLLQLSFNMATENTKIGWILSSKALVQLLANPIAGYLANRYVIILSEITSLTFTSSMSYF